MENVKKSNEPNNASPQSNESNHDHKKYHFKIEERVYEWENQYINEREIRGVGPGIPENMDLFIKKAHKPGRLVEKDEIFDLGEPGIEKFYCQESSSSAGSDNAAFV